MKKLIFREFYSPPALFVLSTAVLSFLSFAAWDPAAKGVLFFVFLATFFYLAWKGREVKSPPAITVLQEEGPPVLPAWFLAAVGFTAVFLRFFKLTSFRSWPSADEALQGFFAINLIHQWSWHFFYTSGQHPPLLIWALQWFFRFFKPPLFNLWFLPALLSTIFVFLGYLAARQFFPKNLSAIFGCLLATAFWPLDFGRFCVQGIWVPVFEAAAFLGWDSFLKAKEKTAQALWAAGLGLLVGIGTWTFTSWMAVVFFITLGMFYPPKRPGRNWAHAALYLLFLFLGAVPWIMAAYLEKFGGYLVGVSMLSGFFSWKEQVLTSFSYLTNLFWGTLREPVSYGPSGGGMLNPVLGAFFFLGAAELCRCRHHPPVKAMGLASVIFLLPGILSSDHVEMFRIIQLMPLLLLVSALGFAALLNSFAPGRGKGVFILLFCLSSLLDLVHLGKASPDGSFLFPSPGANPTQARDENEVAYQWLRPVAQKLGPGLVFTDFLLLSHGHTLSVASYHFNALDNYSLDTARAQWAAIVTNVHYAPLLLKRFPGSQWHPITPYPVEDGGSVVGIIPVTPQDQGVLLSWIPVARYFHRLSVEAENMMNNDVEYRQAMERLPLGYAFLQNDPFLESCYGEWVAQYHEGSSLNWNIEAIQGALQKGYRTANLYYKLGNFYYWNREPDKAKQAYFMAARCRPNYTNAGQVLSRLWGVRK